MTPTETPPVEIVGTLPSPEAVESAVSAITSSGWDRSELSLLAQHHLVSDEARAASSPQAADDPEIDRQAVVSEPDVRQTRTLAAGMAGVVAAFTASGATILSGGTALAAVVGAAVIGGGAAAVVEVIGGAAARHHRDFLTD